VPIGREGRRVLSAGASGAEIAGVAGGHAMVTAFSSYFTWSCAGGDGARASGTAARAENGPGRFRVLTPTAP
jgi:hypothetical protein